MCTRSSLFVCSHARAQTHTQTQRVLLLGTPAAPGTQQQRRWRQSERYHTRRCLCWGFRQPAAAKRVASERGGARRRLALTCTGRGGLRHRTRGLLLLLCLPRASAAPGLAAPLSAPAAASAPRRRPPVRSSAPRRRRRPPPRCGLAHLHCRTRLGHSTRSPPHPAAKVKVASSSPRSRD